jgi:hypothetical protein
MIPFYKMGGRSSGGRRGFTVGGGGFGGGDVGYGCPENFLGGS